MAKEQKKNELPEEELEPVTTPETPEEETQVLGSEDEQTFEELAEQSKAEAIANHEAEVAVNTRNEANWG